MRDIEKKILVILENNFKDPIDIECPYCNAKDQILSLWPKVLSDEKIKKALVEHCNWCEEQLLPDSPEDRNTYTMENIYSRTHVRDIELVKRASRATVKGE